MSFPESRVQLLRSPIPDIRLGGGELLFDVFADQPLRPFRKREFVCQAAFEKHTDAGMSKSVGYRDQSSVIRCLQMRKMAGLGQDEYLADGRQLYFIEFSTEVFDEHIMRSFIYLDRHLADEFEALVQQAKDLGRDYPAGLQSLLDLGVLSGLAQFGCKDVL